MKSCQTYKYIENCKAKYIFGILIELGLTKCDLVLLNAFSSTGRLLYLAKIGKQLSNLIRKINAEPE